MNEMAILESIAGFFGLIIFVIYLYAGDKAIYYIKYHILNTRAEIYSNTGDYIIGRIIWAMLLGWAAIPIALLHNYVVNK